MLKKITALALMLMILSVSCVIPVGAYTVYFSEDFENFSTGNWFVGSTVNTSDVKEEDGNHYLTMNANSSKTILRDDASAPANEFFISTDFMIPVGGSNRAQVLGSTYRSGKGEGCHVWYENGKLTLGYSSQPIDTGVVVVDGLEEGRWYNVFAHINHADTALTPKFTVYFGEHQTAESEFVTKINSPASQGCGFLGRFVILSERDGKDFYIDNVRVIPKGDFELDFALLKARSLAMNANIGYEDGMYPESAADMLLGVYESVDALAKTNSMDDAQKTEALSQMQTAIATFENAKIDMGSTAPETSYIRINESGNMPTAGATYPDASFTMPLEAKTYTKAGVETDDEVVWSVAPQDNRITIEDDILTVAPGFEGTLTLTATAGDLYATHQVKVVAIREITVSSIGGKDGTITIAGALSGAVSEDVSIRVTGVENTDTIQFSDVLNIASDGSFVWTATLPENTPGQYFETVISGAETVTKTVEGYYYGVGWETDVLSDINGAGSDLARILGIHSEKLYLDTEILVAYSTDYCARMTAKMPFATIKEISDASLETEFVLSQVNVTREGIEALVTKYITLLTNNGFDVAKLDGLTQEQKRNFYLNAATLDVEAATATAKQIADKYNEILKVVAPENSNNAPGGSIVVGGVVSGGGGGGVSYGGGGGGGSYPVTLVGGDKSNQNETENNVPQQNTQTVSDFEDVQKDAWSYPALMYMKEKGIMVGDGNKVRPDDSVTRGEFAKIIVTAFGLGEKETENNFTDAEGAWWSDYAKTAAAYGIVNGMGDGRFGGNEVITREMLAVMIDRAITAKNIELYDQKATAEFVDEAYMSDYAKEAITRLGQKGVISGIGNGVFAPGLSVTRAQAAQIVYNVLKQLP